MNSRTGKILLLVVLLTGNIVYLFFVREGRDSNSLPDARTNELSLLQEKRVSSLLDWQASKMVVLRNSEVTSIAESVCQVTCEHRVPEAGVLFTDLSDEQQSDAKEVIAGLLSVYASYTADSQLRFWADRHLALNPVKIDELRNLLRTTPQASALKIDELSDEDIFKAYFKIADLKTHWKAVAVDASCTTFWTAIPSPAIFEGLGASDSAVFSNLNTYHSFFQLKLDKPVEPPATDAPRPPTTFMDAKIVLQYDKEKSETFSPYFIRFWWDKGSQNWQPLLMTSVATESITPPRIIF